MKRLYKLLAGNGEFYESPIPGKLGGNRKAKIYGRLDCPYANRYLERGYNRVRVFFASIDDAKEAGYRPCGICMREEYLIWKASTVLAQDVHKHIILEDEVGCTLDKADYKRAIKKSDLTNNQIRLLNGWYRDGNENWASPELLKNVMGYEEIGRVNIDVGSIGRLIIENLKLNLEDYLAEDKNQTAYWSVYCDSYDIVKGWHLSSEFFRAMIELQILNDL